jgi:voltage-gated potassium channel
MAFKLTSAPWQYRLHEIIFEADTRAGKWFDILLTLVVIFGSLIYLIEGGENGFTSILKSIYWAIVTMTTVGYGDISPQTAVGQALASMIMILGYGIIAVPTGIVTSERTRGGFF